MHYLYPSALFVSTSPTNIHTILGSCVGVCIWDPIIGIGGMNHYMLPFWNGNGLASPKYGNIAIEKLIIKLIKLGSDKRNFRAKVFGGSDILNTKTNYFNIGERNINIARNMLKEYNIPIISSDLGGKKGRKIKFNTKTGQVNLKYIERVPVLK